MRHFIHFVCRKRLKTSICILFALLALAPLVAIVVSTYCNDRHQIIENRDQLARLDLLHVTQELDSEVENYEETPYVHCAYPINIENDLRVAICAQNTEKVQQHFVKFEEYFSGHQVYLPQEIKDSYTRFLWSAINVSKEVGHFSSEGTRYKQMIEGVLQAQNLGELNAVLFAIAESLSTKIAHDAAAQENLTVKRAKSLIHEFYGDGITLDEIAHKLGITPEYLSTQFRKETGDTFSNYIRDFRIKKSKELLLGTQLKLHQISAQIGYSDPKYFSQVFKKAVGQLPADYRKTRK